MSIYEAIFYLKLNKVLSESENASSSLEDPASIENTAASVGSDPKQRPVRIGRTKSVRFTDGCAPGHELASGGTSVQGGQLSQAEVPPQVSVEHDSSGTEQTSIDINNDLGRKKQSKKKSSHSSSRKYKTANRKLRIRL